MASRLLAGLWVSLLLAALASGCTASDPARGLEVQEARAVLEPPTGSVYFKVVNPTAQSDRLLRIETAAAAETMIHESVEENGVMRMVEHPEGFEVPAGGTLDFQPAGRHVMLMDLKVPPETAAIPLTLHFQHAGAVTVQAAVGPAQSTSSQ
jgi:copper(I)-binding protein